MRIGGGRRFGRTRRNDGEPATHRVLVVDDDDGVREYLEVVLQRSGFEVTSAASGEDALERARVVHPDLVTLDVVLPGIDGLETLRRLKLAQPSLHVIMLSGHAPEHADDEARRLGADDFLRKPFEPEALEGAVHRALGIS